MAASEPTARGGGRWRRSVVVLLVVLCSLISAVGVSAVWARRNFLDTERFVSRVGPVVEDPAVQEALAFRLTEQLMALIDPQALFEEVLPERGQLLAVPLANAVEGFVADRVETFMASDRFAALWVAAVETAHDTASRVLRDEVDVVTSGDTQVTLNLLPIIDTVLAEITSASPEILGREVDLPDVTREDVPDAVIARLEEAIGVDLDDDFGQVTVYDDGKLNVVQRGVRLADTVALLLLPLAVLLAVLAMVLSRRRRRTLLQLMAGVALGMVLVRRGSFTLEEELSALPPTDQGQGAAAVVVDAFLTPLTTFAAWTLAAAALVAAVALVSGDYPWATSLRARTASLGAGAVSGIRAKTTDDATVAWVGAHRDALLVAAGVVGAVILWTVELSWPGLLVVVGLLSAFAWFVHRLGTLTPQG